jgi:hypothetical protein
VTVKSGMKKSLAGGYGFLIWAPLVVAVALVAAGTYLMFVSPRPISAEAFWSPLKEIGPAIAGFWVLAAALLTLTAAGLTLRAGARDAQDREEARRASVRQLCRAEVLSFWDHVNSLTLHAKLQDHLNWLRSLAATGGQTPDLFRRNFGDEWFLISHLDPLALAELGQDETAKYLSLSARARHLVHRLTYLNSAPFASHSLDFWIGYEADTLEVLNGLYEPSTAMLAIFGDTSSDPKTFKFT